MIPILSDVHARCVGTHSLCNIRNIGRDAARQGARLPVRGGPIWGPARRAAPRSERSEGAIRGYIRSRIGLSCRARPGRRGRCLAYSPHRIGPGSALRLRTRPNTLRRSGRSRCLDTRSSARSSAPPCSDRRFPGRFRRSAGRTPAARTCRSSKPDRPQGHRKGLARPDGRARSGPGSLRRRPYTPRRRCRTRDSWDWRPSRRRGIGRSRIRPNRLGIGHPSSPERRWRRARPPSCSSVVGSRSGRQWLRPRARRTSSAMAASGPSCPRSRL